MSLPRKVQSEVAIVGAGPGGVTAAIALAKQGIPVTLIDKCKFPRDKICGDALSGKVVEVLNKLDDSIVPQLALEPFQVGSLGVKFIAPNGKSLRVPFKSNEQQNSIAPGFIAKRIDFDQFLLEEAAKYPEIHIVEGVELNKYERTSAGFQCESNDGQFQLNTSLLIMANGAQSSFARQIGGIEQESKHFCAGIRAYYDHVDDLDHENFIELFFLNELLPGYFWIFPLPNGKANVGLGMRSDKVSEGKVNLREKLKEIVAHHPAISERFANATLQEDVKGFGLPLGSKKRTLSGDNYMLVGDAASLIDPFTGEGIGNAMVSGMLAAQQAAIALEAKDFSSKSLAIYDESVYNRLWSELNLSRRMQQLVMKPWLFNLVVNRAVQNKTLRETISCMFEDMDLRQRLKQPSFYLNLFFSG